MKQTLVSININKEDYKKPQKLPRSPKEAIETVRAEILTIFSLVF